MPCYGLANLQRLSSCRLAFPAVAPVAAAWLSSARERTRSRAAGCTCHFLPARYGSTGRDGFRERLNQAPRLPAGRLVHVCHRFGLRSHADALGRSHAAPSGYHTQDPQLSLWPETAIPSLNLESNRKPNLMLAPRDVDERCNDSREGCAEADEVPADRSREVAGGRPRAEAAVSDLQAWDHPPSGGEAP